MALRIFSLVLTFIFIGIGCGKGAHKLVPGFQEESPEAMQNLNYKKDILPIFKSKCSSCHNSVSPPDQPNWLDYKTAIAHKDHILKRVWVLRDMPPTKDLSEKNRAMIAGWIKSGAPEGENQIGEIENPQFQETFKAVAPGSKGNMGSDLVSRGLYLSRAGDCISCHTSTAPHSEMWAGGRKLEIPYGILETPNITPDKETGIGNWTENEFYQALHNGIGKDGEYLYPAFPFTSYTKMPREDVDAIFAYLKTLKPVYNKVNVNQLRFPFNIRVSLALWRGLFFKPETFVPDHEAGAKWNRGAYLVTGPGHCAECHSPRNFMGAIKRGQEFTGTEIDHWYASNLTYSARNGITDWSEKDLVNFLGAGSVPGKTTVLGPMAEVVFNSLQYLTLSDLQAMAYFLKIVSSPGYYDDKEVKVSFNYDRAKSLYSKYCMSCHQSNGLGEPGVYPPLLKNPIVSEDNPSNLINTILFGIPPRGSYGPMPSFSKKLTDQEIADIANYVRFQFGLIKPTIKVPGTF